MPPPQHLEVRLTRDDHAVSAEDEENQLQALARADEGSSLLRLRDDDGGALARAALVRERAAGVAIDESLTTGGGCVMVCHGVSWCVAIDESLTITHLLPLGVQASGVALSCVLLVPLHTFSLHAYTPLTRLPGGGGPVTWPQSGHPPPVVERTHHDTP